MTTESTMSVRTKNTTENGYKKGGRRDHCGGMIEGARGRVEILIA